MDPSSQPDPSGSRSLRALHSTETMTNRDWDFGDDGMIRLLQGQNSNNGNGGNGGNGSGTFDFLRSLDSLPSSQISNSNSFDFDIPTFENSQPNNLPTLLSEQRDLMDQNRNQNQNQNQNQLPSPTDSNFPQRHISPQQLVLPASVNTGEVMFMTGNVGASAYPTPISISNEYHPSSPSSLSHHSHHSFHHSRHSTNEQAYQTHRSHHSNSVSGSGSEYGYSATDVSDDGDIEMFANRANLHGVGQGELDLGLDKLGGLGGGGGKLGAEKTWTQYDQDRKVIQEGGKSRGGKGGVMDEEERKRKERLEHRRSINRKSAQKHRLQRKQELADLTDIISKRDMKIAQLERDLAIEKAKSAQLLEFVKNQGMGNSSSSSGNSTQNPVGDRGGDNGLEMGRVDSRDSGSSSMRSLRTRNRQER